MSSLPGPGLVGAGSGAVFEADAFPGVLSRTGEEEAIAPMCSGRIRPSFSTRPPYRILRMRKKDGGI
jgi:hypothetical protein